VRRAPALSFLLLTVAIDMLGLGLIVPILPALMTAVTGQATSGAGWSGVIGSSYGLLQFAWSAFGLGFVAGPTVGGLLGAVDLRLPFLSRPASRSPTPRTASPSSRSRGAATGRRH